MKSIKLFNGIVALALCVGGWAFPSMAWAAQKTSDAERVVENPPHITGINFSGGDLSYQLIFEYNEEGKLIKVLKVDDNAPNVMNDEVQFSYGTNQVHMSTSYLEKIPGENGGESEYNEQSLHGTFILNKAQNAYTYVGKKNGIVATQLSMTYGSGSSLTKVVNAKDAKNQAMTYVWQGASCTTMKNAQREQLKLSYSEEKNNGNLALNQLLIAGLKIMEGFDEPVDYVHAMGYLGKKNAQLIGTLKLDSQSVVYGEQKYDPNPEYSFTYEYDEQGRLMLVNVVKVDHQKKVVDEATEAVTISNEEVKTDYTIFLTYE